MEPHILERGVRLMTVSLPVGLFPVNLHVAAHLLTVSQIKHTTEKIRASSRVPTAGGDYLNRSAVQCGDFPLQVKMLSVPEAADNPFSERGMHYLSGAAGTAALTGI
jgi:hypothetical protein